MNKSQSLALVAIGVIAVLLVTGAVADPQDAMAGKKHKRHHHNNGGAAAAAAAASGGNAAAAASAGGGSGSSSRICRWCSRSSSSRQLESKKSPTGQVKTFLFFLCF